MELVAFGLALVGLAALALRYGVDSRPRAISSEEERYAQLGVVWDVTDWQAVELRQAAAQWRLARHARNGTRSVPGQATASAAGARRPLGPGLTASARAHAPASERSNVRRARPRRLIAGYLRAAAAWLSADQPETGLA